MRVPRILASILVLVLAGCARQELTQPATRARAPRTTPALSARVVPEITTLRHVDNSICANCHNALTADTGMGVAIAFSHETHFRRGYHCNQCHQSLAHGGRIRPGHPECFACHDGQRASRDCDLCHMRRGDINPHPPNFLPIHDEAALSGGMDCRQCHTETFCLNCHTLQMPHPHGWLQTHGRQLGEGDCFRCHEREYCNQCHNRMTPPSHLRRDWIEVHGEASQRFGNNCALCHSPQYCLNCHRSPMPHPSNWTSVHPGPGRTQTQVCWRCHNIGECRQCHSRLRLLGHPMPFIVQHMTAARQPNPDCRVCHDQGFCGRCHPQGINGQIFPEER